MTPNMIPSRFYFSLVCAVLLLIVGCGSARRDEPIAPPISLSSRPALLGEEVFMHRCNQCHPRGEAGLGPALNNKPLPGFMVKFQVRHGLGAMPAFSEKELSDFDLNNVVAYIKTIRRNGNS